MMHKIVSELIVHARTN